MIRNSRSVTRLFFLVVLLAALGGWWFARANWQPDLSTLQTADTENQDWIDAIAGLGEQAIQLFLGATSDR